MDSLNLINQTNSYTPKYKYVKDKNYAILCCEREAILSKTFRPGYLAGLDHGVFIREDFHPGYRDPRSR